MQFQNRLMEARHLPPGSTVEAFQDSPKFRNALFPPPIERLLYIVNLPAYVFSNGLADWAYSRSIPHLQWLYSWRVGAPPKVILYRLTIKEVGFLAGVILLWYWFGNKVDTFGRERHGMRRAIRPIWWWTEAMIALGIAITLLAVCFICIHAANCLASDRQIATFGLIWPAALLAYFGWTQWHAHRGPTSSHSPEPLLRN